MKDAIMVSAQSRSCATRSTRDAAQCTATGHGASLAESVTPGSLLIYVRMLRLPEGIPSDGRCYGYWRILDRTSATGIEELITDSGWQFFRMEPAIDVRATAVTESSALSRALRKATRAVESDNLNALEIVDVNRRNRFGLYTARVRAVARHIQSAPGYNHGGRNSTFRPINPSLDARRRTL